MSKDTCPTLPEGWGLLDHATRIARAQRMLDDHSRVMAGLATEIQNTEEVLAHNQITMSSEEIRVTREWLARHRASLRAMEVEKFKRTTLVNHCRELQANDQQTMLF